jgi:hypothetical protein
LTTIAGDDVDFSRATPVLSAAQKFVLPVGVLPDAEPLVHPLGTEKAGQKITDWEGEPIGDRGIVFFNPTDKCYQAVPADGRSVVIFNEIDSIGAGLLSSRIRACGEPASNLSARSIARVIAFAAEVAGRSDIYNSTDAYVRSNFTVIGNATLDSDQRPLGWMRRNQSEIRHAVFVPGPGLFKGPAATPQQIASDGAFILRHGAAFRMVERSVMLRTYMNLDCSPLDASAFDAWAR